MKSISGIVTVVLIALSATGCSVWEEIFADSKAATVVDGFETGCPSTPDQQVVLDVVDSKNFACATTACPAGTYCTEGLPGETPVCTADCWSGNGCEVRFFCSCDGRCIDVDSPDNQVTATSCPRDFALLQSIQPSSGQPFPPGGGYRDCSQRFD